MLIAAAVCPCPPLLVPEVAAGAAPELDGLRAECFEAVHALAAARPERLIVVGPADRAGRGTHAQGAAGTFRGFGVEADVRLAAPVAGESGRVDAADGGSSRPLPASLAVGAWLLEHAGWDPAMPVEGLGVGEPLAAERCIEVGRELAGRAERVALLVMGDGTACRTLKAPGYLDERAAPFDAEVARALAAADTGALAALDEELAYELKAAGRAPLQVLAGAGEGARLKGELRYDEAPYGVGYFVASWSS
ncbi:class III extradiol dioxygenase subunit B-like domain-containing protein [Streptomyces rugosispiralis]|uniref:Class III extradiol dioxygenase subunit B-like domain-containing protein n=1 Tax=Streptomyces rugosispiralis TaxID=2967341 RepID=A0ABT1VD81_9ACTN|nr:class III extradiol dioxygenase subunit B-like domain-containing protein [Streptomyces rugosispiralis]MCQ8194700.1 class III extradiol dioxygenase subunit B-like domain-containing protein [Streptomyces rugosispiralis]